MIKVIAKHKLGFVTIFIILFLFFYKEQLLQSYAKFFEKEILEEKLDVLFQDRTFFKEPDKIYPFVPRYQYDYGIILGGNPETRVSATIALYKNQIIRYALIIQPKDYFEKKTLNRLSQFENTSLTLQDYQIPFLVAKSYKNGVTSTLDEAIDIANFCQKHFVSSILIITDKYHTKRAYFTFKKVFETKNIATKIYIIGIPNKTYDTTNWWKSELGLRNYIVESSTHLVHFFSLHKKVKEY
ncbi:MULTISPECIES: ElyC/SanA/YdcF family protein [unclassified Helicobacter]|uniref:ElyC/SanA/YdcF family protein n=1 Tax=unclassified Helicobacter TaxID=2593540 RepID=UPI000CF124D5|nr:MULTISPECIES: ElyC/SanA/YdcF family protein [unclassified Helicobacter]